VEQERVLQELARERRTIQATIRALISDYHSAEDVLQEVFVVALREHARFEAGTNFKAWVREIARRTAWAQLRRSGRSAGALDPGTLDAIATAADLPAQAWESEREALQACVEGLPRESRDLLRRRYTEEEPLTRIASGLGSTLDGIKSALKRLRLRLAACVAGRLKGEPS
jgi:RNA polymerase sigma-70 factor (ECF subfamily)